jgi:hypothetical protein
MLTLKDNRNGGIVKSSSVGMASMNVFYQISSMILIMSSSLMPNISEDRDNTGISVTCSKCNETFETDSDYVVHYNERHAE